jgi:hypothetical protein
LEDAALRNYEVTLLWQTPKIAWTAAYFENSLGKAAPGHLKGEMVAADALRDFNAGEIRLLQFMKKD